ncbi:virginiamycin B lyase family protein [Luminiphilus syltensis]|uniref:virginiamycin B lyase family protein n=1 Tax=Luminiphilus syltensis TaxID=1341119 RepID=UPI0018A853AB|nr:carboxypeptidase regulatory-like domain-containing protein [Luminiphilus syltensis]
MTLTGAVKSLELGPVVGAQISAKNLDRGYTKTVFTDDQGEFRMVDLFPGQYDITAVQIGFETEKKNDIFVSEAGLSNIEFDLAHGADIAQQVSGTSWIAALPDGPLKRGFLLGCIGCHQFGDMITRAPRSREQWIATITNMKSKGLGSYQVGHALMPGLSTEDLATWLVDSGFGTAGHSLRPEVPSPVTGAAAEIEIIEYDVGQPDSVLHDSTVGKEGYGWGLDYVHDTLHKIDPTSGAVTTYELPIKGAGAHTIHPDRNNILWITLQLVDMVASFDPNTEEFRLYGGFSLNSLPHSFAIDSLGYIEYDDEGNLWISEFTNNALASLNPETGEVKEYPLPLTGTLPKTQVGVYGVAIDSLKNVWYTKLNEGVFGKLNSGTKKITQYEMPTKFSGPRRIGVDSQDRLWIPEFATSKVTVFDPLKLTFKSYPLPDKGDYPYALRVDGTKDVVWICGTGSDSIYRLDPNTGEFTQFPLPNAYTFTRQLAIDYKTGDIWTSYSNIPNQWGDNPAAIVVRMQIAD